MKSGLKIQLVISSDLDAKQVRVRSVSKWETSDGKIKKQSKWCASEAGGEFVGSDVEMPLSLCPRAGEATVIDNTSQYEVKDSSILVYLMQIKSHKKYCAEKTLLIQDKMRDKDKLN